MNSAKLYNHPVNEGEFILVTSLGSFEIANDKVKMIENVDVEHLTEIGFTENIINVIDNARLQSLNVLSYGEIRLIQILVNEKVEDFDEPTV